MDVEKKVKQLYYSTKHGFWSVSTIAKQLKIPVRRVKMILQKQELTQLYKKQKNVVYSSIISHHVGDDMSKLARAKGNRGMRFILNIVDVYSRFAWSYPIQKKSGAILKSIIIPLIKKHKWKNINSDKESGLLFLRNLQNEYNFTFYIHSGDSQKTKQGIIERFNRTLRELLQRYMDAHDTKIWYNVLPDFIYNYNHKIHSTTKNKPIDIFKGNKKNEQTYTVIDKLKLGTIVRLKLKKSIFDKKSTRIWTRVLYKISDVKQQSYLITNMESNKELKTRFRSHQLLVIDEVQKAPQLIKPEQKKKEKKQWDKASFKAHLIKKLKRSGLTPDISLIDKLVNEKF